MGEPEMSPEEKALAEEGLRRGVLTDRQIQECLKVRDQMRQIGLEADLAKALLDKRYLTNEQFRMLAAHLVTGNCFRHPDRAAASRCDRCGRPLCADCVIRVGAMTLCGETCAGFEPRRGTSAGRAMRRARLSVWIFAACVVGGGVVLTFLLWRLAGYLAAKADLNAYEELVARGEQSKAVMARELELLEKITSRWRTHAESHVNLARAYRRAGEAEKARSILRGFLERRPGAPGAMIELSRCHAALDDHRKAREVLEEVKSGPDHAEATRDLARLMAEHFADEAEKTEKAVRASLELQPQDRLLRYHLAGLLRRKGLSAEAAREIEAVLRPPKPGTAETAAREAAVLAGASGSDVYLLAAELRLDEGKYAAAVPLLEESLKRNAANVGAGTLLAKTHVRSERVKEARKLLSDLAERVPSDPEVWQAKAEVDLSAGDLDAYVYDLGRLHALRPDDDDLAVRLFEARLDVGDRTNAALLLDELASRGDRRVDRLHARLALEEGNLEEARRLLKKLASGEVKDPSLILVLARMERASGKPEGAAALLSELIESEKAPARLLAMARVQLGLALWQSGEARSAASEFEGAVAGGCPQRIARIAEKLRGLAHGEVPRESALNEVAVIVRKAVNPEDVPQGLVGLAQLAWAKGPLSAAAFAGGDAGEAFRKAKAMAKGRLPSREGAEAKRTFLKRCLQETAGSEVAVARILASAEGIRTPRSLSEAQRLDAAGASGEAMRLALDAQLEMVCQLLAREGLAPVSEFFRRKAAALAAVQEASEPKAVASAYVLAEALAAMLSAGKAGWAYERAARSVVDSMYEADRRDVQVCDQMRDAERAHVLLLNMLAFKRRDARFIVGP